VSNAALQPACIDDLDDARRSLRCLLNPNKYRLSKSNSWSQSARSGHDVPRLEFGGGQPATLDVELLFDTYAEWTQTGGAGKDVREQTDRLLGFTLVDPNLKGRNGRGRPPFVHFHWGTGCSFKGVLTSVAQEFTLFYPNGVPARATCQVGLQEVLDRSELPRTNPTSGGASSERIWTAAEGDTLALIAHREYGDATQWRRIADANRLSDVRRLAPGTTLVVPHGG
jgi:nucleoid-associated protein YgaU